MEIFLTAFYFALCCFLIAKLSFFKKTELPTYWFIAVFGIKVLTSFLITLIYTNYYTERVTADIFKYFDDSKILFDSIKTKPLDFFQLLVGLDFNTAYFQETYYSKLEYWNRTYNANLLSDTHLIIRFNMFLRLFSFGFYQVHNVLINFLALLGLVALYKAFLPYFVTVKKLFFLVLCFIPSFLFWGSGLLKEGLIIFALGFLLLHFFNLFEEHTTLKSWCIVFAASLIILFTKFNVIIGLVPSVLGYIIYKKIKILPAKSYLLAVVSLLAFSFVLLFISDTYNPFAIIINKQHDFIAAIHRFEAQSAFEQPPLTSVVSVFMYMPQALINVLFRPFLWETYSVFTLISGLENVALFISFVFILIFRKSKTDYPSIFYFCLLISLTSAIIIGLTTPIFGAIVRYKIFTLLFLMMAFLLFFDVEKFKNSWFYTAFKK